jgi:hypothetical protein
MAGESIQQLSSHFLPNRLILITWSFHCQNYQSLAIRSLDAVSFDSSPGGIARGILMLARPVIDEDFFSREKVRGSQEIYEKWGHRDASSE